MRSPASSADHPLLELINVNSFYGAIQVHFDLSLHVPRGEIVCLLGGNASGKSTTMKVILGLLQPKSGAVNFDGDAISRTQHTQDHSSRDWLSA